jgi:outer membrane protein assembly factor BamE (lipoprotein component of BamABCDE complex)
MTLNPATFRVAVLLAASLLAGCAIEEGKRFTTATVQQLQPGVSTEQDAIAALGTPVGRINNNDGTHLLQWQYIYGSQSGIGGSAHAAVLFGSDQKVIRVVEVFQQ